MPSIPGFSSPPPKRKNHKLRLEACGLTEEQFRLFRRTFFLHRPTRPYSFRAISSGVDQGWSTSKYGWEDRYLEMHLTQEHILGLRFDKQTRFVAVDLDCKNEAAPAEPGLHPARARMDQVIKALGGNEPIVFRSSVSGGIHLYWFLDDDYEVGIVGLQVKDRLERSGVRVADGWIEVPQTSDRAFRLPLGLGSDILDPDGLFPIADTLEQQLIYLREVLPDYTYSLGQLMPEPEPLEGVILPFRPRDEDDDWEEDGDDDLPDVWAEALAEPEEAHRSDPPPRAHPTALPTPRQTTTQQQTINGTTYGTLENLEHRSSYKDTAERALKLGLEAPSTRRATLQALVPYLLVQLQLPKRDAKDFLKNWIRENHNGKSRDINAGRIRQTYTEIHDLIDGFRIPTEHRLVDGMLTKKDIHRIEDLPLDLRQKRKIARFVQYARSETANFSKQTVELRHVWFRKIWGCTRMTATKYINLLLDLKILEIETEYLVGEHGRTYRVNWPRSYKQKFDSFDEGLVACYSEAKLKTRYSTQQVRKIQRLAANPS